MSDTADFFRSRLDQMIELRHPLAVLASRLPWQELEAKIAHLFAKKVHAGKDRSGPANLNSAISGNSGHEAGPRAAWQRGVFNGQEINAAHSPHPYAGVPGPGGPGGLALRQDPGRTGQAVRSAPQPDHRMAAEVA